MRCMALWRAVCRREFFGVGRGGKTWIRERDLLFCPQIVAFTCFCVLGKGGGSIVELFGCIFSSLGVNCQYRLDA